MVRTVYHCELEWLMICRKKERTTALVVSAVLAGFKAIDTGQLLPLPHAQLKET